MITFRITEHDVRKAQVVEILSPDGKLLGALYAQEWGVRLMSKYLSEENVQYDQIFPPTINVKLP